ncbi:MAG: hypothetical protein AAGD35_22615 [Actinomycetota bacterium]
MRFTKPFWAGIADGTITVAFRPWKRPTVVVGRAYRTGGGRVEVMSVDAVALEAVTDDDAARAGHASADEIRARHADMDADRTLYRVSFRRLDEPDPREALANASDLAPDDVAEIDRRLDGLDRSAARSAEWLARTDDDTDRAAWTRRTLRLIAANPEVRAPDLAAIDGRETAPFKLDVRKLKNLGLTTSLRIGYCLSPRGAAYLAAVDNVDNGGDTERRGADGGS